MTRWFKRQSLVVNCSIVLSLLFIVLVSVISTMMYQSSVDEIYRKFNDVGNKLRDVAQANLVLAEKTAPVMEAGQEPPEEQMAILKRLLSGTTDDYLVANAYYLLPVFRQEGELNYFRYLQASDSMESLDIVAGSEYEDHGSFSKAYEKAIAGEAGLTDVFADAYGEWLTYLAPITDAEGKVVAVYGIDYDYHFVSERLKSLVWRTVGISAIALLLSILITVLLLRTTLKPLRLLAERAKEAAGGDLTVSVPVTNANEVGQAGTAFNEMVSNLRQLVMQISRSSGEVSNSSQHLKGTASQTELATKEIVQAISQVAVSAESQLVSSSECQRAMTEMAVGIQRIAESSSVVADLAADTSSLANAGAEVIGLTVKQIGMIEERVDSAAGDMHELNNYSSRINEILAYIGEVANQTNLLALNAAIEAAKAGEHGNGFAVVAHEIRKLAERSKSSSEEVTLFLREIGMRSQAVAESLNASSEVAREGTKLANASGESFHDILNSIKQVSGQIQEVSAASQQMSAGSEEIAASLEELEHTAQISASNAEQIAASSQEQLASVEEVSTASRQLSELAVQLGEGVGRFKV
ncbi:methyl-accepting chemotaxis protein [Paenibacillus sp. J5C_2022]|uniref:methyl-accepting chemotaxis protein n=1 Tax=Paenibacillus sp. J5C2022 TaxID=2977129 RepID=UPI0021D02DB6|nr:methyl-accepting chemotaxis protein [Paenibacillus sp. J5C2022]MCU6710241.1 methyl-accepting chemotaxis protein [Paenibacillus sp. J5C2022]